MKKKTALNILFISILGVASIVTIFFLITAIRFLWFRPLAVSGDSMTPTLQKGSLIYINTIDSPDYYDVACFYAVFDEDNPETLPSAAYYGANAFWRSMPIWGTKIEETYSGGYDIYVKRVVGTQGDTIELRKEVVDGANLIYLYRNGKKVEEKFCMLDKDDMNEATIAYGQKYIEAHGEEYVSTVHATEATVVPEGYYYVLSDNRDGGIDSRLFGAVQAACFIGTVRNAK